MLTVDVCDRYAQMRGGGEVETLVSAQNLCQENSAGLWAFKEAMPVDPTAETAEGRNSFVNDSSCISLFTLCDK